MVQVIIFHSKGVVATTRGCCLETVTRTAILNRIGYLDRRVSSDIINHCLIRAPEVDDTRDCSHAAMVGTLNADSVVFLYIKSLHEVTTIVAKHVKNN